MMVHPIIAQIVDRQHVGQSNRSVIQAVVKGFKKRAWKKMPRADRRQVMRQAIYQHSENLAIYRHVMGGIR